MDSLHAPYAPDLRHDSPRLTDWGFPRPRVETPCPDCDRPTLLIPHLASPSVAGLWVLVGHLHPAIVGALCPASNTVVTRTGTRA